jgi:Lon protease-like protein
MAAPLRIPVFPLAGALLFPRAQLPLHIFEPRYRAMVRDALAGDRLIGMVQPPDTLYRQVEADRSGYADHEDDEPLGLAQRAELEQESRRYADALGYAVDWDAVSRLDDEMLVNGIAQIAPLDIGSKQALLEARDIAGRCELLVQFMQFQRMIPGGADGPETLQ